ncbi:MAG: hypothetical protein WDW38_004198 [Sanguina aurantia]
MPVICSPLATSILAALVLHVSLLLAAGGESKDAYHEEVRFQWAAADRIMVQFEFNQTSSSSRHHSSFPRSIQRLASTVPFQTVQLSLTSGRWVEGAWVTPPELHPMGAELRTTFPDTLSDAELQDHWVQLTHSLGGLFCASLSLLAQPFALVERRLSLQDILQGQRSSVRRVYASLPREAVCTENLTPWLRLLPCRDQAGVAMLLQHRPSVFATEAAVDEPGTAPGTAAAAAAAAATAASTAAEAGTPRHTADDVVRDGLAEGTCSGGSSVTEKRSGGHGGRVDSDGDAGEESVVCIFQVVPWFIKLWLHSMELTMDGQVVELQDYILTQHIQPAVDRRSLLVLDICLLMPRSATRMSVTARFTKAFLTAFEYPPDGQRGFDLPPAIVTAQDVLIPSVDSSLVQTELRSVHVVYSDGLLIPLAVPDFSMPYNVIIMTSTVVAVYLGALLTALLKVPDAAGDALQPVKSTKTKIKIAIGGVLVIAAVYVFLESE